MNKLIDTDIEFINRFRVAVFASLSGRSEIGLVPMCFALDSGNMYVTTPVTTRKLRNLSQNPTATILIHEYDEDWSKLKYVMVKGRAVRVHDDQEYEKAKNMLDKKYEQFVKYFPITKDKMAILRVEPKTVQRYPR